MTSILRSSKFVRYFAGIARNIVFNSSSREVEGNFLHQAQVISSPLSQNFATSSIPKDQPQGLESSLRRLDQDVRRTGRISRRDIEEILDEIRSQRSATSSQSLLMIRCCGNLVPEELPEKRTALVQEIWKTLNNLMVPMDISHYNALLRVYLENEYQFSPTEFLADLEAKGVEPNRVTYQRLISRYCQQGDIEGATRILEFMREKELPVNEHVFNALIMGHSQADDIESAVGILSVMKQAGLEPSADTFTTLLCGYAKNGNMEEINKILDKCEKDEIFLLDKDLMDVIYVLATNGHANQVDGLIKRFRKGAGFNQDAVNLILRLVNKGQEEVAYKVLCEMPRGIRQNGETTDTGIFMIRQMVKARRPLETIKQICSKMEKDNLNERPYLFAVESCLNYGELASAVPLMHEIKEKGYQIKQHYFWPLLCAAATKSVDDVLHILRVMQNEFNISANGETIREYVIPNLQSTTSEQLITLLRSAGISTATASVSVIYNLLLKNRLKEATEVAGNYRVFYSPGLFRKPLLTALNKTKDYENYVLFVRHLYDNLPRGNNLSSGQKLKSPQETEEEGIDANVVIEQESQKIGGDSQAETLGEIVYDLVVYFRNNRIEPLSKVLQGLVDQGLQMSNIHAERIQEKLGSELTTEISTLLGTLTGGDLQPVPLEKPSGGNKQSSFSQMTVDQIQNMITNQEAKGENVKGLKRFLLSACFKSKDITRTEEVIQKFETEGYVLTSGVYAQLIDLYSSVSQPVKAVEVFNKIRTKEPDFVLDNTKVIRLVTELVNAEMFDEALKILETNRKEATKPEERSFNYNSTCWRLLNSLAETGKVTELDSIFDTLVANNYIEVNNVLLGPLIKVHLVNNDIEKAITKFEEICNKYKTTPWKNELACRLIQKEDASNLQRLTDLSTNIHGEVNSLYDLVFAFVECGRVRQARKILETPGLRNRPQRINTACQRYSQEGLVEPLEGLVEATKDLSHIDRSDIYYNLLLSYCKEDNPQKSLGLWTKMQEDDIQPSDQFLLKLSSYLKSKNVEVPFVVPKKMIVEKQKPKQMSPLIKDQPQKIVNEQSQQRRTIPATENVVAFKQALKEGDVDKALSMKNNFNVNDKLSVSDQSILIEELLKNDRTNEAKKLCMEMLQNKIHPIPRIFRFLLNKLANGGDVESLKEIGQHLSAETKKLISFDNRFCHANIVSGKCEQYLSELETELQNAKNEEEVKIVGEKFPRGGAIGILETLPELAMRFEKLAKSYADRGIIAPMNVLWMHHFVAKNMEESERIWKSHLSNAPRLMFQRVVTLAREKQDDDMIRNLISVLKQAKVSEGAVGNAYSCLLDIHTTRNEFDRALEALDEAIKDVCLENINRTALMRIKEGVEAAGKSFPHKIPKKKEKSDNQTGYSSSSTSSSSSSDDEPVTKPIIPKS